MSNMTDSETPSDNELQGAKFTIPEVSSASATADTITVNLSARNPLAAGYQIRFATAVAGLDAASWQILTGTGTILTLAAQTLKDGATVHYQIRAFADSPVNDSDPTATADFTVLTPLSDEQRDTLQEHLGEQYFKSLISILTEFTGERKFHASRGLSDVAQETALNRLILLAKQPNGATSEEQETINILRRFWGKLGKTAENRVKNARRNKKTRERGIIKPHEHHETKREDAVSHGELLPRDAYSDPPPPVGEALHDRRFAKPMAEIEKLELSETKNRFLQQFPDTKVGIRRRAVAEMLAWGSSIKEIHEELGVSCDTIGRDKLVIWEMLDQFVSEDKS